MNMIFLFKSRTARRLTVAALIFQLLMPSGVIWAAGPQPLSKIPVPLPPDAILDLYVQNRTTAIQLGKALFWDMQAGSDGRTACASCHYKAGADPINIRSRNQLNPGPDGVFQVQPAATSTLTGTDFPFFQVNPPTSRLQIDPLTGLLQDPLAQITRNFNDVTGSQGVHKKAFTILNPDPNNPEDNGALVTDQTFSFQGQNVRQVTGQHAARDQRGLQLHELLGRPGQ